MKTGGATGFAPTNGASIARSPVVVAMPEPIATAAGWPNKKLSWTDLLQQITTGSQAAYRHRRADPGRAGLSGLLALGAAAGAAGGPDAQKATTSAPARAGHRPLGAARRTCSPVPAIALGSGVDRQPR